MDSKEVESYVLAVFANTAKYHSDRRGGMTKVDPGTGLPLSGNDLLPRYKAISGDRLALELYVIPSQMAAGMVHSEDVHGKLVSLSAIPREHWTPEDIDYVADIECKIKRCVHRLAEECGAFILKPEAMYEGEVIPFGEDGMTMGFKITPGGLRLAKERTAGTPLDRATSIVDDLSDDAIKNMPDWAQADIRRG